MEDKENTFQYLFLKYENNYKVPSQNVFTTPDEVSVWWENIPSVSENKESLPLHEFWFITSMENQIC